jgi:hypothetical protein
MADVKREKGLAKARGRGREWKKSSKGREGKLDLWLAVLKSTNSLERR